METRPTIGSLTVILRSDCTLRCAYCYQGPSGALRMSWPVLRASLDVALASSSRPLTIEFSGGEPLLAFPLIRQALGYVKDSGLGAGVRYALTTNGTLLSPDVLDFLDGHLFEVRLSFHAVPGASNGREAATFRRLDAVLDTIKLRHAALWRERLRVTVTAGLGNLHAFADTIEYLVLNGVREVIVSAAFGEQGWRPSDIRHIKRQFKRITALMRRERARSGRVPLVLFRKPAGAPVPVAEDDRRCSGAVGQAFAVDPNGHAYGCVMLAGARPVAVAPRDRRPAAPARRSAALALDVNSPLWSFSLGDVRDAGFCARLAEYPADVARSGLFEQRRVQRSSYGCCGDCRFIGECLVCPGGNAFGPHADPNCVSDFVCAFNRVMFAERERFPAEPSASDRMSGRAPVPALVRELRQHAARRRRAAGRV